MKKIETEKKQKLSHTGLTNRWNYGVQGETKWKNNGQL